MNNNSQKDKTKILNKKPYQTPEMKIYGKIADITYGAPGSGLDGAPGLATLP